MHYLEILLNEKNIKPEIISLYKKIYEKYNQNNNNFIKFINQFDFASIAHFINKIDKHSDLYLLSLDNNDKYKEGIQCFQNNIEETKSLEHRIILRNRNYTLKYKSVYFLHEKNIKELLSIINQLKEFVYIDELNYILPNKTNEEILLLISVIFFIFNNFQREIIWKRMNIIWHQQKSYDTKSFIDIFAKQILLSSFSRKILLN